MNVNVSPVRGKGDFEGRTIPGLEGEALTEGLGRAARRARRARAAPYGLRFEGRGVLRRGGVRGETADSAVGSREG